jgi:hypothetical protein
MIQGASIEQYKHFRIYAAELQRSHPNSTMVIKSKVGVDGLAFESMYVCFYACKRAFATTCSPLMGMDGFFFFERYFCNFFVEIVH